MIGIIIGIGIIGVAILFVIGQAVEFISERIKEAKDEILAELRKEKLK